MAGVGKEVEDTEVRNIVMIDKIVLHFFLENAYNTKISVNKLTHFSVTNTTQKIMS